MSQKIKKQFGVWMDSHHAIVVGRADASVSEFSILGQAGNAGAAANSSEKTENNDEKTLKHKFYKQILAYMPNAEEVHLTGTGTAQEQFMHYMTATPQFKDTVTHESTATKMSDDKLVEYIHARFK
jgi:stalled ribosome rescue protein Dom34